MLHLFMHPPSALVALFVVLLLVAQPTTSTLNYVAPSHLEIGSRHNPVTADPLLPRPSGVTPCTVHLFTNTSFVNYNAHSFEYSPPAQSECPGPWDTVLFEAKFWVTPGRQYDRTVSVFLGSVLLYFGSTAEPSNETSPEWFVESDLTDYSAVFGESATGTVNLGTIVSAKYNGVIHGSADLVFYPSQKASTPLSPPPPSSSPLEQSSWGLGGYPPLSTTASSLPSLDSSALPLSSSSGERAAQPFPAATVVGLTSQPSVTNLYTSDSELTFNVSIPASSAFGLYLDVWLQGQSLDEFWYTCVTYPFARILNSCESTGLRLGMFSIDGKVAAYIPVFPWVFTGGIDPFLWRPVPGVHTLNFEPYRVNLSPWIALLNDGESHVLTLKVINAHSYFSVAANLLVYSSPKVVVGSGTLSYTAPPPHFLYKTSIFFSTGGTYPLYSSMYSTSTNTVPTLTSVGSNYTAHKDDIEFGSVEADFQGRISVTASVTVTAKNDSEKSHFAPHSGGAHEGPQQGSPPLSRTPGGAPPQHALSAAIPLELHTEAMVSFNNLQKIFSAAANGSFSQSLVSVTSSESQTESCILGGNALLTRREFSSSRSCSTNAEARLPQRSFVHQHMAALLESLLTVAAAAQGETTIGEAAEATGARGRVVVIVDEDDLKANFSSSSSKASEGGGLTSSMAVDHSFSLIFSSNVTSPNNETFIANSSMIQTYESNGVLATATGHEGTYHLVSTVTPSDSSLFNEATQHFESTGHQGSSHTLSYSSSPGPISFTSYVAAHNGTLTAASVTGCPFHCPSP